MNLTEGSLAEVWEVIAPVLDERQKRVVAGGGTRSNTACSPQSP